MTSNITKFKDNSILKNIHINIIEEKYSVQETHKNLQVNIPKLMRKLDNHPTMVSFSNLMPADNIINQDDIQHDNQFPDEKELEYALMVIKNEVLAANLSKIKWTNLKHLPSMQYKEIQDLYHLNFSYLNIDKNSDILTIATTRKGDLLNTHLELNSVLHFLENNTVAEYDGVLKQTYSGLDNYEPLLKVYYDKEMVYLVVFEQEGQGFEGHYIYAMKKK